VVLHVGPWLSVVALVAVTVAVSGRRLPGYELWPLNTKQMYLTLFF
jgi:hypothetical protein